MEDHAQGDSLSEDSRELGETRTRMRLRGLFASTDAGDAVADLIAAQGRELEVRSEKLLTAVHDLERREERARELHMRVEQILREGSAELDERQAELNARAAELDWREVELATAEEHVTDRARQLGAVELRRAAVERREESVRARAIELERQARELAMLATRLDNVGRAGVVADPRLPETAHVVLTVADKYRLLERDGPTPAPGDRVELDDGTYRCVRLTRSPYPPIRAGARCSSGSGAARALSPSQASSIASPRKSPTMPPTARKGPYGSVDLRPFPAQRKTPMATRAPRSEPISNAKNTSRPSHAPMNAASLTSPMPSPAG